ncbi:MAG: FUN14 domain-containing protein [Thermofilaceae archaeon]
MSLAPLYVAGGSLAVGYLMGWALRKVIDAIETVVALYLGATAFLVYTGVITINVAALVTLMERLTAWLYGVVTPVTQVLATGTVAVPLLIGLMLGLAKPPTYASGSVGSQYLEE